MITDIPQSDDFRNHGVDYLNLGWGTILQVLLDLADAEEWTNGLEPDMRAEFWDAAHRELATSLSLVEQGMEFLLKARICEISPWLLISRQPTDWPRRCDTENIAYSQFRTVDAQDLLKVHNTFAANRLPDEFAKLFEALRRQRNSIMHTVDVNLRLTAPPLLDSILLVVEHLLGARSWVQHRRKFLERDRHSAIDVDFNEFRVAREFLTVIALLGRSQLQRYFGFEKRQRAYACPNCSHAHGDAPLKCFTAQLRPNSSSSTTLYCFICDRTISIERRRCPYPDCKGNVYHEDYDECLTCQRSP